LIKPRRSALPVLVDQSAEDLMMSNQGIEWDHGGGVMAGRVLVASLVQPVIVEMALVLVKDGAGVLLMVISSLSVHSARMLWKNRWA